jgi:hypothetical protein
MNFVSDDCVYSLEDDDFVMPKPHTVPFNGVTGTVVRENLALFTFAEPRDLARVSVEASKAATATISLTSSTGKEMVESVEVNKDLHHFELAMQNLAKISIELPDGEAKLVFVDVNVCAHSEYHTCTMGVIILFR